MLHLFQTGDGPFFRRQTCLHLSRFVCCIIRKYLSHIIFGCISSQSVSQWNSFSPSKYIVYNCYSCFRPGMGQFISSSHLSTLVAFFAVSSKIFIPFIVLVITCLSLFRNETLFLLQNTLDTNVTFVSDQEWAICFIVTLVYTCRAFFAVSSENIYLIYCFGYSSSQSVSTACHSLFRRWNCIFFFKIHWIQMLHLFQTRDGPIFFIDTLVYTCRAFFAVWSKNIYSIYCFGYSLSQSVSQWNSNFSFKIHWIQMLHLFQTRDGPIFFIVTLVYTCCAFLAVSLDFNCPIYCFGHSLSQSVSKWNSIFSFKLHCLQMFQLFQTRDGPIFFIVTLVYTCRAFLLYQQ